MENNRGKLALKEQKLLTELEQKELKATIAYLQQSLKECEDKLKEQLTIMQEL